MYDEFGGEWRAIFKAKPYQGQDPEKAKVLFVGRDANYPDLPCKHPFFERIKEYHRDGVAFWEKCEVHHPFLCDDFPFPRNAGGRPYHKNFTKLGLDSTYAKYISFIELRELPTRGVTGKIPKSVFISSLTLFHMQRLDRWISQSGRKLVFLPKTITEDMLKFRKKNDTNLFQFLNFTPRVPLNANGLPVIYADNDILVLATYHFSATKIFGITSKMKTVIDLFLQGQQVPLTGTKTGTLVVEELMATDEFPDFCKRVVGKTGWFPRGETSVVLVNFELDPGVGRCQINRPAGVDPRLFLLHRDEVDLGIRACRKKGQLIMAGELRLAGIRGFAVAPLYGLLKLYFDQVGFLDNP